MLVLIYYECVSPFVCEVVRLLRPYVIAMTMVIIFAAMLALLLLVTFATPELSFFAFAYYEVPKPAPPRCPAGALILHRVVVVVVGTSGCCYGEVQRLHRGQPRGRPAPLGAMLLCYLAVIYKYIRRE